MKGVAKGAISRATVLADDVGVGGAGCGGQGAVLGRAWGREGRKQDTGNSSAGSREQVRGLH